MPQGLLEAEAFWAARELSSLIWPLHNQSLRCQPSGSKEVHSGSSPVLEPLRSAD